MVATAPAQKAAVSFKYIDTLTDAPKPHAFILQRFARGVAEGVFEKSPDGQLPDTSEAVLALNENLEPVGFATFYEVTSNRLWIHLLWVEPDLRRRGLGRALLQRVRRIAGDERLAGVVLGRHPDNETMRRLLDRQGWAVDQVVHSHSTIEG